MTNLNKSNKLCEKIVNRYKEIISEFFEKHILSDEHVQDYKNWDLHSWLQYAMIKAGEDNGLFAVPEVKLKFEEPLDPQKFKLNKKRKRHFKKVDVAFYDNNMKLVGFSEIFTADEAHGCLPTVELAKVGHEWVTPRDALIHTIRKSKNKVEFVILVVALPKKARHIAWKTKIDEIDSELKKYKNYYKIFGQCWRGFCNNLRDVCKDVDLVVITEDGIE